LTTLVWRRLDEPGMEIAHVDTLDRDRLELVHGFLERFA
jgi:hypothetical protein